MINRSVLSSGHPQLLNVIAQVRGRWRLKLFLRGLALSGAAALVAFIVSAFVLEKLGFAPAAVVGLRLALYATVLGIAVRYLVLPLLRRVSDQQVALYLEEHEASLDAAVLSAVELRDAGSDAGISAGLARRTIETAIERCAEVDEGRRIDRRPIRRFGAAAAAAGMLGVALVGFSPAFVRHGANALLDPLGPLSAASPYRIAVEPGNVTIPRGADQEIHALLGGFTSENVEVVVRRGADAAFERIPMAAGDSSGFELLLFDIDQPTEYFVEAGGVRSPVHRIEVADLPYVQTLQLVYHFPAYTGLEPRVIEAGGDIAVLRGTTVEVRATPTIPTPAGEIVVGDTTIALEPDADGVLAGSMRVDGEGFYHLEMTAPDGASVTASPVYSIDVLDDMAPAVSFSKPGRDARVSAIEEMFVEAKAEDDYGIAEIDLVYSVNGGEEQTQPLYRSDDPLAEVSAGHTFYLEELELEPGDLVAYHARVKDNNAVGGGQSTKSDIYFLTVRPFGMNYRQSQQAPGGGGGGGGGIDNGRLSEIQREIISATFNVSRDGAEDTADFAEKLNTIALSQEKLREQVETLAQRMNNRGITRDSSFQQIAGLLPQAAEHMGTATGNLREREPTDALPPEQKALQILLRAEAIFRDVQVALGGGGGGGGGGSPNAEDLADLFELELDKLRNQYETVQRGEREQTENQVDETLERLRELARRQQQEAERLRRQAQAGQGGSSNSAQSQRQLAEETEQAARELERLSRETQQPQLMEAARRLQEAADAMRRSAANARSGNSAEAARALDRIEEARRRLEGNRSSQLEQETQQALERAEDLVREQREIEADMNRLNEQTGAGRSAQARQLIERKEQQHGAVDNIERQLDRMANDARGGQPDAARELQEAANSVRDNQIKEMIRFSRALTEPGADPGYAREMEADITNSLEQLRDRIAEAGEAVGRQDEEDRVANSLEQTRDLVRGMESLSQRTGAAQQEAERRRLGERPGQQGGQDPQQGQAGEQGGEGQQQGGQGQQQGGQGQQQGGQGQQQGGQGQQQGGQGQQQGGERGQGGQGQAGERGQAAGQPGGEPRGGERTPGGSYNPGSGGDARGAIAPGDVRQFRREVRERLAEAEQLRDQLARDGQDVSQLDDVIRNMRELDEDRIYGLPLDLDRLQSSVVDGLKQFEYALRRQLQGDVADNPFLSGSDEVPEGYRALVEEYYRALSRRDR